jgi:hypothetical protein
VDAELAAEVARYRGSESAPGGPVEKQLEDYIAQRHARRDRRVRPFAQKLARRSQHVRS